jgi:hypothetical protein
MSGPVAFVRLRKVGEVMDGSGPGSFSTPPRSRGTRGHINGVSMDEVVGVKGIARSADKKTMLLIEHARALHLSARQQDVLRLRAMSSIVGGTGDSRSGQGEIRRGDRTHRSEQILESPPSAIA